MRRNPAVELVTAAGWPARRRRRPPRESTTPGAGSWSERLRHTHPLLGVHPGMPNLTQLRQEAAGCTACELYADATQTVFGRGSPGATMVLVGEQPGDREDIEGEPFVGPAGRLLDRALEKAGVARADVYVTNVVKHFRFRREGKRRIHRTPSVGQVRACAPWLQAELAAVRPQLLVALGATAAKALLGSAFRLTRHRGEVLKYQDLALVATIHPSAVLRGPEDRRTEMFDELVADLTLAGRTAAELRTEPSPARSIAAPAGNPVRPGESRAGSGRSANGSESTSGP